MAARSPVRPPPASAGGWLIWALLGFLLAAALAPLAWAAGRLFVDADGSLTLARLTELASDGERLTILARNSALVVVATAWVAVGLGAPLAFLCFRTALPGRRLYVLLAGAALLVPLYVVATSWTALLGNEYWRGFLLFIERTTGLGPKHEWVGLALVAGGVQGLAWFPLAFLVAGATLRLADPELEDAARLEGGLWAVWRRALVPQVVASQGAAALLIAFLALGEITVTDLLMLRTFAEESFTRFKVYSAAEAATALALPAALAMLLLALLWYARYRSLLARPLALSSPRLLPLGRWGGPLSGLCALVLLGVLGLPLWGLVRAAGSPRGWLTALAAVRAELTLSVLVAVAAATLACLLGLPLAWGLLRLKGWRWLIGAALVLLLATPAPVLGVSLIQLLNQPWLPLWLYDSPSILVHAALLRTLPFATLLLFAGVRQLPPGLEEAAALDGADLLARLRLLLLPLLRDNLLAAWMLCYALSLGEIGASVLVAPPGRVTLSIQFFQFIHFGVYEDVATFCLAILATCLLPPLLAATWLWHRREA